MKTSAILLLMIFINSCATEKPRFVKEKVCSNESLKYLKNPRNRVKRILRNPKLTNDLAATSKKIQVCYEDYRNRTGHEEFNTCMVVGVDQNGRKEFYNFSSEQVKLDKPFRDCAEAVIKGVPFERYGKNYILIQAYKFYVGL